MNPDFGYDYDDFKGSYGDLKPLAQLVDPFPVHEVLVKEQPTPPPAPKETGK